MSSVFPSSVRPGFGLFVRERIRHVAAAGCEVVVVAPIPWFPLDRLLGRATRAPAPFVETQDELVVYHPRFLCVPGVAKSLDGLLYAASLLPWLVTLRRRFRFEVIDAHFAYPDGFAATLLARVFRCPVLITLRGSHDIRHAGYRLRAPQIGFALRAADRVIAVSQALGAFAIRFGLGPDRVRVIPNGVDPTRFALADRLVARRALGLPTDRRIMLSVGSLVEGKGHHRVVDVLSRLVAAQPDLIYVVVGNDSVDPGYRRQLEDLVKRRQLEQHVVLVGERPHEEIPSWMSAADLFCLATRWEGWCNAITEALACGLPVVTTAVGGNAELVRNGRDGFLIPFWDPTAFGDSVLAAFGKSWDRSAISEAARARGWNRTAELVIEEFEACLRG